MYVRFLFILRLNVQISFITYIVKREMFVYVYCTGQVNGNNGTYIFVITIMKFSFLYCYVGEGGINNENNKLVL